MTLNETIKILETLGNEKVRAHNTKFGARSAQFGVKMGDIRALAKKIKADHQLALELWDTGNIDARFLAVLIIDPKKLTAEQIRQMAASERFVHLADWFTSYVIRQHPDNEQMRLEWISSDDPMLARAAWYLTADRLAKKAKDIDIQVLLNRIEVGMATAPSEVQWTMNSTLAQIGINFADYRTLALSIGEKLGIYRDYPVSKGCTSPFAPIWINEMVKRIKPSTKS